MNNYNQISIAIVDLLKQTLAGLSVYEICEKLSISRNVFYICIKEALAQKIVIKTLNKRPVIYKVKD